MTSLTVSPISSHNIERLQDAWNEEDFKAIIELLDGELAGLELSEIEEYMNMLISDADVPESAYQVLKYLMGGQLSEGQLRNLSNEMEEDRMWEEYPDIKYHKPIFRVNQLLYRAYNGKLQKANAKVIELEVKTTNIKVVQLLLDGNPDLFMRIIMGGCDDHAKMHRLYDEEVMKEYIEDAQYIIWHADVKPNGEKRLNVRLTSSTYWLDDWNVDAEYIVDVDLELYEVSW